MSLKNPNGGGLKILVPGGIKRRQTLANHQHRTSLHDHGQFWWKFVNKKTKKRESSNPNQRSREKVFSFCYLANFSNDIYEKGLWKLFESYGRIIDVMWLASYISKFGWKFAFARFLSMQDDKADHCRPSGWSTTTSSSQLQDLPGITNRPILIRGSKLALESSKWSKLIPR